MDCEKIKVEIENSRSLVYDKDGNSFAVHWYNGVALPESKSVASVLSKIHKFPIKDDDIFIFAFPTAGTHWIWEVTSMIVKGKAERILSIKEEYMMDFTEFEKFESLESPRLLNSHYASKLLPTKLLKDNKIIFIVRNPKAVVVSYYRHLFGISQKLYNGKFSEFFELFMKGNVPYGDYFEYIKQWWQVVKDNPNALIITYKDASENLPNTVSTIAEFLGKDISKELAMDIADLCSFDKMKKDKKEVKEDVLKITFKENYSFYRSGKVSAWKEWLTVAQNERMDARIQTELIDQGIILNI